MLAKRSHQQPTSLKKRKFPAAFFPFKIKPKPFPILQEKTKMFDYYYFCIMRVNEGIP
jgi:hypothetical protein